MQHLRALDAAFATRCGHDDLIPILNRLSHVPKLLWCKPSHTFDFAQVNDAIAWHPNQVQLVAIVLMLYYKGADGSAFATSAHHSNPLIFWATGQIARQVALTEAILYQLLRLIWVSDKRWLCSQSKRARREPDHHIHNILFQ
jgi:hypothetical protein